MNKVFTKLIILSSLALFGSGIVCAQEATDMTLTELVAAANSANERGEPKAGIPFLEEIVKRAPSLKDETALQSVQQVRLQLGRTYAQLEQWDLAEKYAREYLSIEPCTDRAGGLGILCQTLFLKADWQGLKKSAQDLFNEPGKGRLDREHAELFLAQAHFNLEEYDAALEFIPQVLERADDPDRVASLRLMQTRCLFETGQGENLVAGLSDLARGDARYDIHLNLLLIRMGDDLFDKNSFRQALAIYRVVIPRAELIDWHAQQRSRLPEKMARLEVKAAETGDESGKLNVEIGKLKEELDSPLDVPEYDVHIAYRVAQIYAEQKRLWEAVAVFDDVYRDYPQEWQGSASLFEMVLLLDDLGQDEEAIALGRGYLDNNRSGLTPRLVNAYLMRYYHERQKTDDVLDLFGYVDGWEAPEDDDVRAQETGLRYMACFAWLGRSDYARAAAAFESVIEFSPDSQPAADSHYWRAMCSLMQQDYQDAHDRFVRFRSEIPHSAFASSALFRTAVCSFGLEDYEGAKVHFDQFIQAYPNNPLLPEALTMRGDLLGADGMLDEALADYRQAIDLSGKYYAKMPDSSALEQVILPATYALSQTAKTLELDAAACRDNDEYDLSVAKYRQVIAEIEHYETLFGKNADFAQAVFLKSKAQFQLGEADQAVQACLDTVSRYGADPAQQGVAAILFDLGSIINTRLNEDQRERALARLRQVREEAEAPTLQLRLDVLLAELDGTKADLGRRLLAQEESLAAIPPSALGLMCSAALDQRDFSRAAELFDFFVGHYDDSPSINSAYQLRAEDFFQQKEVGQAMALATEALELFGAVPGLGWAQLLKGRGELELGKTSQAAETFNQVFNVPSWRGPLYAESMLLMADAWFAQGNVEKAFAFYQRTYLLYPFYDNGRWAADAYLKSAECLYKLKRASAARNTYRAMLLDESVRDLSQAEIAKKVLGPEETADLMAGQTNRLEAVSTEMEL